MRFLRWAMACAALFGAQGATAQDFKDKDWSHTLYANCRAPDSDALTWASQGGDRGLRVRLDAGDRGTCSSDRKSRHGAPFWERAEVRQRGSLAKGHRHDIRFMATFERGFQGRDESFFQIQGWSRSCNSAPVLMMRFDRGKLDVQLLQRRGNSYNPNPSRGAKGALTKGLAGYGQGQGLTMAALGGKPTRFRIVLDDRGRAPSLSFWVNDTLHIDAKPVYIRDCATPHVKLGLYRPGRRNKETSVVIFDDIRIQSGG